ncbi:MAG: pyruvate, phosphate dikinase, partial [Candidatus Hydrothermarchaeota archaeon]
MAKKYIYLFEEGNSSMKGLLGGKGAGLAEMSNIGLQVPPGFIITTEACKDYNRGGKKFPKGLEAEVYRYLVHVEERTGRRFGDQSNPLFVSVRSGAPVSMPGMMDTVLNLGMNDATVAGFIAQTRNERFGYDCYRRFIQMFAKVVLGIKHDKFEEVMERRKERRGVTLDIELDAGALKEIVQDFKGIVKRETGRDFPMDPKVQLRLAIAAVFDSWNSPRAIVYRREFKILEDLGTAVCVVAMVFGNVGMDSGTGVAFTRDPATGEKKLYGEYLMNAQGEDVVAGTRTPITIDQMLAEQPQLYRELAKVSELLERHYKDVQDMEFTIERGKLYMLQTRRGERTAQAAVNIAVDMAKEGLLTKEEALLRVQPAQLDQLLHRRIDPKARVEAVAKGLPASPGAACGTVIFDVDETERLGKAGKKVILVRPETTPEDIHGMVAAQGVLTSRGGMTSHAAVVARGMGKPCVAGCEEIRIDLEAQVFRVDGKTVKKGDIITLDGATGQVILGEVPMVEPDMTLELKELLTWADAARVLGVRANADNPQNAARARDYGAEGIGLCRTERMFNAQDRLPIVQEMILAETEKERRAALEKLKPMQKGDFLEIFKAMDGLPVTIRLLDPPLHEFLPQLEDLLVEVTTLRCKGAHGEELTRKERVLKKVLALKEHNPMLGHRGCRLGIKYPEIYEMQVMAIFEAAAELQKEGMKVLLEIMLPLIGEANELRILRDRIECVARGVMGAAGVDLPYSIGTMIEIPRAALTADEIARYAEFFSFGTNDLTQTTFGYSRDDAEGKFIHYYLENKILESNPFEVVDQKGVGKLMRLAVENGRKTRKDLKVGICGEQGG